MSTTAISYSHIVNALMERCLTDSERANLEGTAARVAKALDEMVLPKEVLLAELTETLKKDFILADEAERGDENYVRTNAQLVVQKPIQSHSVCPHHLLPIDYTITLALLFDGDSRVLGLSKYARVAKLLARRAVVQEQYAKDLVTVFTHRVISNIVKVDSEVRVLGAMSIVDGSHGCMRCRGVESGNTTITPYSYGLTERQVDEVWAIHRG